MIFSSLFRLYNRIRLLKRRKNTYFLHRSSMSAKTGQSGYLRFLKDEKFIEWKLFPTDELTVYWEDFLHRHPGERENMDLAEGHFRNIKLSAYHASREKKEETIKRLEQSVRQYQRKREIRRLIYAAACVTALILSVLYLQPYRDPAGNDNVTLVDYIVGNELEAEDIRLIASEKTESFKENIDIEISNGGVARVKTGNERQKSISMDKNTLNRLIVPYGKRSVLTLADGSKVWLNSGSVLEFPVRFPGENREISLLSGEIYIEVAPDKQKPFRVRTSDFNVKVYGTKFNISTYADSPHSVVLVEGSVGLQPANEREVFLSPNQRAVYTEGGTFDMQKVDVFQLISWKNGYLMFDDTPMTEVLNQIERYYNLSFDYGRDVTLKDLTCTGKIVLSENLDNVMTTIALLTSTKYWKENDRIFITNDSY